LQLLTRDPLKRLGGVDKAALDIKSHPFFRPIDWAKLDRREIEPSFKPPVHSVHDLSQIDPDFTAEEAVDSWVEKSNMTQTAEGEAENPFKNFTWQNDHMEEQLNKTAEG
jgi:serum/glucocorticoid-regulated kinase 2